MAVQSHQGVTSPKSREQSIGDSLERFRLSRNITQTDLAAEAGVSERTLRRLESGDGATLDTVIRVLAALQLDDNLALLVPDPRIRPIERVHTKGHERQRSSPQKSQKKTAAWEWGKKE